ncbi:MAG: family 16 glycoside hydrolase [Planctomycetota bacterium]
MRLPIRPLVCLALALAGFSSFAAGQDASPASPAEIAPGWHGDPAVWRVDGSTFVGSTHSVKLRANTFLIREGELRDFELTCEVRLEGANNGGVQYRSRVIDAERFRVHGYQCDVHPKPEYFAMLYDEGGGGIVAQHGQVVRWTDAGRKVLGKITQPAPVDLSQWTKLRIIARGDVVWHEVDGRIATVLQDQRSKAPKSGQIALQVHRGPDMVAHYRAVAVTSHDGKARAQAQQPLPAAIAKLLGEPVRKSAAAPMRQPAMWIWDEAAGAEEELFLRQRFQLAALPKKARLAFSCDNNCRVYVNGQLVGRDDSWETPTVVEVAAADLRVGENVVAVHGWNEGGPAGMALRMSWRINQQATVLQSDASWRCSNDDPDGWSAPGFDDSSWATVRAYGRLGASSAPWTSRLAANALGSTVDAYAPQTAAPATDISGPWAEPGNARVVELLQVPRELGSWVSLCCDPQGRLYASSQKGGLFRITPAGNVGEPSTIERVPVALGGAHGLLWWRSSLYAVVNGKDSGFYRMRDSDDDGMPDDLELLQAFEGRGEHGPHSVEVAPDGEHLLVLCGNHTLPPTGFADGIPHEVQEDRLVARLEDPHTYWEGHSPRGGWVCQCDADGNDWQLLCCGFRNPFDLAVLPDGQVWVYDADMEWDMGMPWYRPTRLLKVVEGVDYGWRIGSAKWPTDYPDAPLGLRDLGPGSPTGMDVWGEHVIALDWTFGTVYANGEPVLVGAPLPLADAAIAPDGRVGYLVTGGRGLPSRVLMVVPNQPFGQAGSSAGEQAVGRMQRPAGFERRMRAVQERLAAERLPRAQWRAADPGQPLQTLAMQLAITRQGGPQDLPAVLRDLGTLSFAKLERDDQIAWLRAHALALMRLGPADAAQQKTIADRLMPLFPTGDERFDQDLCELLVAVRADGLLEKAVPLLATLKPSEPQEWAEVASRNERYGSVIMRMLGSMPPSGQLAIVQALCGWDAGGWTIEQRRTLFAFLEAARQRSGGSSYDGFVIRLVDAAWATCSDAEKRELEFDVGRARAPKRAFASKPPKGPGQNWQLDDIPALVAKGFDKRRRRAGRNLFWAAGCASCHYFQGEGGFGGPDLTTLKNKFRAEDLLESILEPSKDISDQYSGSVLTKRDGSALFGVVHKTHFGDEEVYEVIPAEQNAKPVRVLVADVDKVEPSPMSPMPKGLLNRLSADEVRDLVAFLLDLSK